MFFLRKLGIFSVLAIAATVTRLVYADTALISNAYFESRKINGASLANGDTYFYGTSDSKNSDKVKSVAISGLPASGTPSTGLTIIVKPSETSKAGTIQLKLNNTTAADIYYNGDAVTAADNDKVWKANVPSVFVFDGSHWVFAGGGGDNGAGAVVAVNALGNNKINGVPLSVGGNFYGTEAANATAADNPRVVEVSDVPTTSGQNPATGQMIVVKPTTAATLGSGTLQLKLNTSKAASIYYNGEAVNTQDLVNKVWKVGVPVTFVFDGINWVFVGTDTTYQRGNGIIISSDNTIINDLFYNLLNGRPLSGSSMTFYATSSSNNATETKIVTFDDGLVVAGVPVNGQIIVVQPSFTVVPVSQSDNTLKLNLDSSGAKNILYQGATVKLGSDVADKIWSNNYPSMFMYSSSGNGSWNYLGSAADDAGVLSVTEGSVNGAISVDGTTVNVHGLSSSKINGVSVLSGGNFYGTETSAGVDTNPRVVSVSGVPTTYGQNPATGQMIVVKPATAVKLADNSTLKLKLNTSNAANIYYNGEAVNTGESAAKVWKVGVPATFVFDGTNWVFMGDTDTDTDTTYNIFEGANGSANGKSGLVPRPLAADNVKFLKGDGTWAVPTDTNTIYTFSTGLSESGNTVTNDVYNTLINGQRLTSPNAPIYIYAVSSSAANARDKSVQSISGNDLSDPESGTTLIIKPSTTHSTNIALEHLVVGGDTTSIVDTDGNAITGDATARVWNSKYPSVFTYDGHNWVYMGSLSDFAKNTLNGRPLNTDNATFYATSSSSNAIQTKLVTLADGAGLAGGPINGQIIVVQPSFSVVSVAQNDNSNLQLSLNSSTAKNILYQGATVKLGSALANKIWNNNYPSMFVYSSTGNGSWNYLGSAADDNTGVRSIVEGDTNGTFTVNTNGNISTLSVYDMTGASVVDNTPMPGRAGLVPAPEADAISLFLRGDGEWAKPTDTTYNVFDTGTNGLVPGPTSNDSGKFLGSDGWSNIMVNGAKLSGTSKYFYGAETTASPAASSATKTVTINDLASNEPATGQFIIVNPQTTPTSNPSLKIKLNNGTDGTAYSVYYNGSAVTTLDKAKKVWTAGVPSIFVFDASDSSNKKWNYVGTDTTYTFSNGLSLSGTAVTNDLYSNTVNGRPLNASSTTFYATSTSDNVAETKIVTLADGAGLAGGPINGQIIVVQPSFTAVSASASSNAIKLNLNSSGAKDIVYQGDMVSVNSALANKIWNNDYPSMFVYNSGKGGYWNYLGSAADDNTKYTAGAGIDIDGTTISNTGVLSVTEGSVNGAISVDGTTVNVHGLSSSKINGVSVLSGGNFYGTETSAGVDTNPRVVSVSDVPTTSGQNPATGQMIVVKPTTAVKLADNSTLKLKLNTSNAANIYYNGEAVKTADLVKKVWKVDVPAAFVFDGTNWVFMGDTDTTYGLFTTSADGLVPASDGTNETNMFLKGNGNWSDIMVNGAKLSGNATYFHGTGVGGASSGAKTVTISSIDVGTNGANVDTGLVIVVTPSTTSTSTSKHTLTLTGSDSKTVPGDIYYNNNTVTTAAKAEKVWKAGVPSMFVLDKSTSPYRWNYVGTDTTYTFTDGLRLSGTAVTNDLYSNTVNGRPLNASSTTFYATSSTASDPNVKEITMTDGAGFISEPEPGQVIVVQPAYTANCKSQGDLSILFEGSKNGFPVKRLGELIQSGDTPTCEMVWNAGYPSWFVFYDDAWNFLGNAVDENTQYLDGTGISLLWDDDADIWRFSIDSSLKINGVTVASGGNFYGTETTNTIRANPRRVSLSNVSSLTTGQMIIVTPASNVKLAANSTLQLQLNNLSAYDVYYKGEAVNSPDLADKVWKFGIPSAFVYYDSHWNYVGTDTTYTFSNGLSLSGNSVTNDLYSNTVNGRPLNASSTTFYATSTSDNVAETKIVTLADGAGLAGGPINGQIIVVQPSFTAVSASASSNAIKLNLNSSGAKDIVYQGDMVSVNSALANKIWNNDYPSMFVYNSGKGGYWNYVGTDTTYSTVANSGININANNVITNSGVRDITTTGADNGQIMVNKDGTDTPITVASNMTPANGTNGGGAGLVPAPIATDNVKFLKGDATWSDIMVNGAKLGATSPSFYGTGIGTNTTSKEVRIDDIEVVAKGTTIIVNPESAATNPKDAGTYILTLRTGAMIGALYTGTIVYDGSAVTTKAVADKVWKPGVPSVFVYDDTDESNKKWIYIGSDTTYSEFAGTDAGLVPASTAGVTDKFLKSNGDWSDIMVNGVKLDGTAKFFYGTSSTGSSSTTKKVIINDLASNEPADGQFIIVNPQIAPTSGSSLKIQLNNGTDGTAYSVYYNNAAVASLADAKKIWKANVPTMFVFDGSASPKRWNYVGRAYTKGDGIEINSNTDAISNLLWNVQVNGQKLTDYGIEFYATSATVADTGPKVATLEKGTIALEGSDATMLVAIQPSDTATALTRLSLNGANSTSIAGDIYYGGTNLNGVNVPREVTGLISTMWNENYPSLFLWVGGKTSGKWIYMGNGAEYTGGDGINITEKNGKLTVSNTGLLSVSTSGNGADNGSLAFTMLDATNMAYSVQDVQVKGWETKQTVPTGIANGKVLTYTDDTKPNRNVAAKYAHVPVTAGGDPNATSSPAAVSSMASIWVDNTPLITNVTP